MTLKAAYYSTWGLFIAALGLVLLVLVDMVRGFFGLGLPLASLLLGGGAAALWWSVQQARGLEAIARVDVRPLKGALIAIVFLLLLAALFAYRFIGAARIVGAGRMGLDPLLPVEGKPLWLVPFLTMVNYLDDTWLATLIGVLMSGAFLVFLPRLLKGVLGSGGITGHLGGAVLALPNMFCSCCTAPVAAGIHRGGAAMGPTLAFFVAAPSLNITTLTLAFVLLPPDLAAARIGAGLVAALGLSYVAAVIGPRLATVPVSGLGLALVRPLQRPVRWMEMLFTRYCELFHLEELLQERNPKSPSETVLLWLNLSWRVARTLVPLLMVGYLMVGLMEGLVPEPPRFGMAAVPVAAALGTITMIPTWVEIPIALGLVKSGHVGAAAALLVTLPVVSLPSLWIVGGAINSHRTAFALGVLVFLLGTGVGTIFQLTQG